MTELLSIKRSPIIPGHRGEPTKSQAGRSSWGPASSRTGGVPKAGALQCAVRRDVERVRLTQRRSIPSTSKYMPAERRTPSVPRPVLRRSGLTMWRCMNASCPNTMRLPSTELNPTTSPSSSHASVYCSHLIERLRVVPLVPGIPGVGREKPVAIHPQLSEVVVSRIVEVVDPHGHFIEQQFTDHDSGAHGRPGRWTR